MNTIPVPEHLRKVRPLPTLAELEEVERLGQEFHDALEGVSIKVESMDSAWANEAIEPEALPTHEQIGFLYLFGYWMQMRAEEVSDLARRIEGSLPGLESLRTDAPMQAARKAAEEGRGDA